MDTLIAAARTPLTAGRMCQILHGIMPWPIVISSLWCIRHDSRHMVAIETLQAPCVSFVESVGVYTTIREGVKQEG